MYRDSRKTRVVLALLILTSFTLITVDYRAGDGTVLRGLRTAAAAVFGPVQRGVTNVVRPIGNALSTLGDLGSLNDQAAELRAENAELKNQLHQLDDLRRENDELRRLNGLTARGGYQTVRCRVVAVGPHNFEWTATVDCGAGDGIEVDQTVLNADGLVGKVVKVAPFTAQVLLAADPEFTVIGRLAGHGTSGPVTGNGLQPMEMHLLEPTAEVTEGEAIVSQGVQGGIVAGVPIGVVSHVSTERSVLTRKVSVKPFVRFGALDVVAIVVEPPRKDPRDSLVLTPTPTPSPSPTLAPPACPTPSPLAGGPPPSPCPTASPSPTPAPPRTFGPPSPSRSP
ncbi:MAG TPA: rod shape-determining protein MreC [Frankiaceae bacterium]|nr:rod shape-determining protein MreC [Frankiaceae bacterium]